MASYSFLCIVAITLLSLSCSLMASESTLFKIASNLKCPPSPTKCKQKSQTGKYPLHFDVGNGKSLDVWAYHDDGIVMGCNYNSFALDDPSFARWDSDTFIPNVVIFDCIPPKNSFLDALRVINITFDSLYIIYTRLDDKIKFNTKHFEGLDFLKEFRFEAKDYDMDDYFDLELLKHLSYNVSLVLIGPKLSQFPTWNKFENVFLESVSPLHKMQTWENCYHLRNLTIQDYKTKVLPEGWLAKCTQLEQLRIANLIHLVEFPKRMLENTNSLLSLTIKNCNIEVIPDDLLMYSKNLKYLDLSGNEIGDLIRFSITLFSSLTQLETLILSQNGIQLKHLGLLQGLKSLKYLSLDSNYRAGLCENEVKIPGENTTYWPYLPSLVNLSLSFSAVTRPCQVWRDTMPSLKYINISNSDTFHVAWGLTYEDIKLIRESGWNIDATNNVIDIIYNESDYKTALLEDKDIKNEAIFLLSSPLECNCKWYWFIKTLKERPNHIYIPGFSCMQHWGDLTPRNITEIDPEEVMCALDNGCPENCKCFKLAGTGLVLVNCTETELTGIPDIDNVKEMVLPNNHVSILRSEDVPNSLQYLDISNNQLTIVTPDVAKMLFSVPSRKMQLSGNPFICHCENKEFLELLRTHQEQLIDFNNLTCIDGSISTPLKTVDLQSLCASKTLTMILILLGCIAVVITVAGGIYYLYRNKIRSSLIKYGFKFVDEPSEINKIYDAFISYSHEDSWFVIDELMPVLEEQNSFKLCVHTRDWMAGDWIPAQIARSVQDSRRTVIVLSNNFLSSIWSLLEFRTAHIQALHDKQTRVIIILLEDLTSGMKMDIEMEKYLTTNTYIKWGEPNFWKKLCKALKYKNNEKQIIEAGEEVVKLYRSDDPPIVRKAICDVDSEDDEV